MWQLSVITLEETQCIKNIQTLTAIKLKKD